MIGVKSVDVRPQPVGMRQGELTVRVVLGSKHGFTGPGLTVILRSGMETFRRLLPITITGDTENAESDEVQELTDTVRSLAENYQVIVEHEGSINPPWSLFAHWHRAYLFEPEWLEFKCHELFWIWKEGSEEPHGANANLSNPQHMRYVCVPPKMNATQLKDLLGSMTLPWRVIRAASWDKPAFVYPLVGD